MGTQLGCIARLWARTPSLLAPPAALCVSCPNWGADFEAMIENLERG
jgi:hypothetical protein